MDILDQAKENMLSHEKNLCKYACKSSEAILLKTDKQDVRPAFYKDIDRIIHSLSYTRYIDKTQVFSFEESDHITHRVLHVQLVSKIARTIGRSLKLNEDLIEAIALGHDVGHTPFGHKGEGFLNEICKKEKIGTLFHNAQGVKCLKDLENLNITIQTLDGILAHNGEILKNKYDFNKNKTKEEFLEELEKVFKNENYSKQIKPMTQEACVVRISDIIAYIGRDIEDAIIIGILKRKDIPEKITKILGTNNSKIVDTLIKDIIINSIDKPFLSFSKDVFDSLMNLKKWNYEKIYNSKRANKNHNQIKKLFNTLFYIYLEKIENIDLNNIPNGKDYLYKFLKGLSKEYIEKTDKKRIIIDYISGQTDNFFLKECEINIKGFKKEKLYI